MSASKNLKTKLPAVKFAGGKIVDWKKHNPGNDDDEELKKTPKDVIKMLGFDPRKIKNAKAKK